MRRNVPSGADAGHPSGRQGGARVRKTGHVPLAMGSLRRRQDSSVDGLAATHRRDRGYLSLSRPIDEPQLRRCLGGVDLPRKAVHVMEALICHLGREQVLILMAERHWGFTFLTVLE